MSERYEKITYQVKDHVATVALNDPDTRNSFSDQMLDDLLAAFKAANQDDQVRCIVLTSTDEKVFSSGGNLKNFAAQGPLIHKHFGSARFVELFTLISSLKKPSICAANGHVLAGAFGVALACDLIIARDDVTFSTPEINVGVFPFMIMALIYRNVPRKKTNELLLLGERFSAQEAAELGIINKVVSADEFDGAVSAWATKLANSSPLLMRMGKEAMYRQQDMGFADALEFLHAQLTLAFSTDDIQEGVNAFFEKRDPLWKGH